MSPEVQGTIMAVIDIQREAIGTDELYEAFGQTHEVLVRVAHYSQLIRETQMVCNHSQQIIDVQPQITNLQTQQFQPLQRDHSWFKQRLATFKQELEEAKITPRMVGTDEDLRHELDDMSRDAQQLGEEVWAFGTQLANTLSSAARAAPTPLQHAND